jgi:hypothetical protein
VFSFKPRRVVHETLEITYDLYENKALLSFVERTLAYLDKRLKEASKLEEFFNRLKALVDDKEMESMWYRKRERNLYLIGLTYQESHEKASHLLRETRSVLSDMRARLARLRDDRLFRAVGNGRVHTPELRATNVLVNHKHYRYLRLLWPELNAAHPEPTEQEKLEVAQRTYQGLVDYVLTLFHYCLDDEPKTTAENKKPKYFGYKIVRSGRLIESAHDKKSVFPNVTVKVTPERSIALGFGAEQVEFVVIGNAPMHWDETEAILEKQPNRYLLYLDLERRSASEHSHSRIIPISPYDVDSTERVSRLIRGMMLQCYHQNLVREFPVNEHILREFLPLIKPPFINFDSSGYQQFRFTGVPRSHSIRLEEWKTVVQSHSTFGKKGLSEKKALIKAVQNFYNNFISQLEDLKSHDLFCFNMHCDKRLDPKVDETNDFNYLRCNSCGAIVELKGKKLSFRIEDPKDPDKYRELKVDDWGCDHLAPLLTTYA